MKRITLLASAALLLFGMTAMAQSPEKEQRQARHYEKAAENQMHHQANKMERDTKQEMRQMKHDASQQMHKAKHHTKKNHKKGACCNQCEQSIKILSPQSVQIGEMINLDFIINYDKLFLNSKEQFAITPYIANNNQTMPMPPVIFISERCYNRMMKNGGLIFDVELAELQPYEVVVMSKKEMRERRRQLRQANAEWIVDSSNSIEYSAQFPYQPWMNGGQIKLHHALASCNALKYEYTSNLATLYNPIPPQVAFIIPEVETVKARTESMTSRLVFMLDKTNIDLNIFNNSTELDDIYKFTDKIVNNPDVKINSINLTGYASPEGPYKLNTELSIGRMESLKTMLQNKYPTINADVYKTNNVPEDWDSVRKWAVASDFKYRDQIIEIINTIEPDKRDAKVAAIDKGTVFKKLLHDIYPGLRRAVYTIDYTVMPFTIEQSKLVMVSNPEYLSLNEFYQIALLYPTDSDEYAEVFEMAVRYYPNDPVANNNMAALALQNNDAQTARIYLEKIMDYPKAQNNIGVMKAIEGNLEEAAQYFQKAIQNGSKEAERNLQNLSSLK